MDRIVDLLYNEYPREILLLPGIKPKREIINDKESLIRIMTSYNGLKRVFVSVYNKPVNGENININKLPFDFDSEESLEEVIKMHNYLKTENYKHAMFFSGNGFHIYVFTEGFNNGSDPKQALLGGQNYIVSHSGLSWGKILDRSIRGDIKRVLTAPGTYNLKRGYYCIGVDEEDLNNGFESIREKAKMFSDSVFVYGNKNFSLKSYNFKKPPEEDIEDIVFIWQDISNEEILERLPPCIGEDLQNKSHLGNRQRFKLLTFCREMLLPMKQALGFCKEHLSEGEYKHMVMHERQHKGVYSSDTIFPVCKTNCCEAVRRIYK